MYDVFEIAEFAYPATVGELPGRVSPQPVGIRIEGRLFEAWFQ